MKIANLYAGIGGNRRDWGDSHQITAVESDEETAKVYKKYFPEDEVIVADAHQYLIENYKRFDFIWSSPPCPTHSNARYWSSKGGNYMPVYPDMRLYQEIIFLKRFFEGKWVVENVIPYYEPLITPNKKIHRHLYWSNFKIGAFKVCKDRAHNDVKADDSLYGFNIADSGIADKVKALRNMVRPDIGKYILDRAQDIFTKSKTEQKNLF